MPERKFFSQKDIILIVAILVVAMAFYLFRMMYTTEDPVMAEIVYDGQVIEIVALNKDSAFTTLQAPQVVFEIKDHAIRFKSSDCSDQVCVRAGYLTTQAHFAACLPNRLALRILGDASGDEPDLITQ